MSLNRAVKQFAESVAGPVAMALPPRFRDNFFLRLYSFLKIPVLNYVMPSVVEMTEERCVIRIPLRRRTQNHLGSMYFAVLAAGADCAGGLIAMRMIHAEGKKVSLIFKDFHAEFLKRVEGDALFTCEQGKEIRDLVKRAIETGDRVQMPVQVLATVPSQFGEEAVARFTLTLSLKHRHS